MTCLEVLSSDDVPRMSKIPTKISLASIRALGDYSGLR